MLRIHVPKKKCYTSDYYYDLFNDMYVWLEINASMYEYAHQIVVEPSDLMNEI